MGARVKVPRATEEYLRHQLKTTDLDDAVENALNYWIGTAFRFVNEKEPSDQEEEEMREGLYELAKEIEQEE